MAEQDTASIFAGLTIERGDALPKRVVGGRESIPNPFVDVIRDSFAEAKKDGPDKAVRAIYVPISAKDTTVRTVVRKDKNGKPTGAQWQQHDNVNTALYLLRQAAIKNECGVRIVVDYAEETVPSVTAKVDDKTVTLTDVTLHKFAPQSSGANRGRVRIRFVGQPKKKVTKKDENATPEESAA